MKILSTIFLICTIAVAYSQPFIRLTNPSKTTNAVRSSRQFIIGATCKNCALTINGKRQNVYATGAFAYELNLLPGDSLITLLAETGGKSLTKKITYSYTLPKPAEPVKTLDIETIRTLPEGDLVLMPGDVIKLRVKALTNCIVRAMGQTLLYELPVTQTGGMPGIYQGEYTVKESDSFKLRKFPVTITDSTGKMVTKETVNNFSVLSPFASDIAVTKGRLAHLEYGLGDDRLGGAKIGYLDSNVVLKIVGKVGAHYKVQLAKTHTAYIPDELVELMPKGTFTPESLTTNWTVYGDDKFDYVKVGLFAKLPYQSFQLIDPAKIVVDIYGATNNTNWITQLQSVKEIKNVYYEQKEDDVFRVTIELKHAQHWGHQIYYAGNSLVIKVKHQPENLSLKNLTIAVDAGHGGSNTGAGGPTGVLEKELTLAIALKLQNVLEKEGAKVIMTRTKEQFFDNKERILFYRDSLPDLLISIHLNSSEDPIRTGGTAAFYRYVGFRNLSLSIYKRMLELSLKEYGNTGSFNFMLNSPTEYPNALVETLFLSNPEEEMKVLDPNFQQQMADKMVMGIKDFLDGSKEK
ncbi:MAG: N-acetylmuramoyl-L-alanine amidase [Aquabacterium sp.]|nr:N-acetylmuramoyl-L-alanine amidase [Ferruginibacter sp.]